MTTKTTQKTESLEPSEPNEYVPTFVDLLVAFKQPLDPSLVKERYGFKDNQGNVHNLSYVEWQTVADILDEIYPPWTFDTTIPTVIGNIAVCKATITIDGITRTGIGTGNAETDMGIKKSEHDALKRAAVKFGIARTLYQSEAGYEETQGAVPNNGRGGYGPQAFPENCRALNESQLASERQIGAIRAIAKSIGLDPDHVTFEKTGCDMSEINGRAASAMIDWMKAGNNTEPDVQVPPPPFVPPVSEQLPAGVTRGMPPSTIQHLKPVPSRPEAVATTNNPAVAKNLDDMVTMKQLGMIRAVSRSIGRDPDKECIAMVNCRVDELSKRAASDFIEHLQRIENNPGNPVQPIPTTDWTPEQHNTGVDQGLSPAPVMPASAAQGRMAGVGQIKAITHYCSKTGYIPAQVASEYSHGRTDDPAKMSEAEAEVAIQVLSAL